MNNTSSGSGKDDENNVLNTEENDDNFGDSAQDFAQEYMAQCKEQLEKLYQNPEMLEKTLKPLMESFGNPEKLSKMFQGGGAINDEKFEALTDLVKKVGARIIRLEKRLEESGVLKKV